MNSEQFAAHPLWSTLESISANVSSLDLTTDAAQREQLDEIRKVLAHARSFRGSADPLLVTHETLLTSNQSWASIGALLVSFGQNPAAYAGNLTAAVQELDSVLAALARSPQTAGSPAARSAATRALSAYRGELDAGREALQIKLDEVLEQASQREAELSAEIATLKASLEETRASHAAVADRIALDEARLDTALTTNNETFIAAQSNRDNQFAAWLKAQGEEFSERAKPHLSALVSDVEDAGRYLQEVAALRTSTVEMGHMAASDILADDYMHYAKTERRGSLLAYGVGAIAILAGVFVLAFAFEFIGPQLTWTVIALKFALSAAIGGGAAVAFRFGGKALDRSTSFKRQELELRALQPFLKDVVNADLAKTSFVERAFGHAWAERASGKGEPEFNDAMLKLLAVVIQNSSKAGGPGVIP